MDTINIEDMSPIGRSTITNDLVGIQARLALAGVAVSDEDRALVKILKNISSPLMAAQEIAAILQPENCDFANNAWFGIPSVDEVITGLVDRALVDESDFFPNREAFVGLLYTPLFDIVANLHSQNRLVQKTNSNLLKMEAEKKLKKQIGLRIAKVVWEGNLLKRSSAETGDMYKAFIGEVQGLHVVKSMTKNSLRDLIKTLLKDLSVIEAVALGIKS